MNVHAGGTELQVRIQGFSQEFKYLKGAYPGIDVVW